MVNAFAEQSFGGNPAGVFFSEDHPDLDTATMQAIARQMNLVETAFVQQLQDDVADFEIRYFTPEKELPIAGHPTVAAIIGLMEKGAVHNSNDSQIVVRTKGGDQEIAIQDDLVFMQQPQGKFYPVVEDRNRIIDVFGISETDISSDLAIQPIDSGLGHLIVPLQSESALMKVQRNIEALKQLCDELGVMEAQLFAMAEGGIVTRNICPRQGLEDPACGVGNGALGYYLLENVYPEADEITIIARQGDIIRMPSTIYIHGKRKGSSLQIHIAGKGKVMIKGFFSLI